MQGWRFVSKRFGPLLGHNLSLLSFGECGAPARTASGFRRFSDFDRADVVGGIEIRLVYFVVS